MGDARPGPVAGARATVVGTPCMHALIATFTLLVACGTDAPEPTTDGTLLHVDEHGLIVQHDDVVDRVVPGTEWYARSDDLDVTGLEPGDHVDLWLEGAEGTRSAMRVRETGTDQLPERFRPEGWPLQGTVVRRDGSRVTVDHEAIDGLMDAMVMPFSAPAPVAAALEPGDVVRAKVVATDHGFWLVDIDETGHVDATLSAEVEPLEIGGVLPRTQLPAARGEAVVIGEGQPVPSVITFLYTTCPDPAFCPALVARLQPLQAAIEGEARIVAVTIDPEHDTEQVLRSYAEQVAADPETWRFARPSPAHLHRLALLAGLTVSVRSGRITHGLRLLVLDDQGRLVERYDDNAWPLERVVTQLRTGEPAAESLGSHFEKR